MLSKTLTTSFLLWALVSAKRVDRNQDDKAKSGPAAALPNPSLPNPSSPGASVPSAIQCAPLHIIVARATGEAPGEGTIGGLADKIKQSSPGCTSEALVYPATLPYNISIPVGVANLKAAITRYQTACPASKMVLMGYSQGAAVMVDTLCGGGGDMVGPSTPGLTADQGSLIKAAVAMGDPRFVPGVSYNFGTNKSKGGVAERSPSVAVCSQWAPTIISYCDKNDIRCASGNSLEIHLSYVKEYSDNASKFIINKLIESE